MYRWKYLLASAYHLSRFVSVNYLKVVLNWIKLHTTHMRKIFNKLHGEGINNVLGSRL